MILLCRPFAVERIWGSLRSPAGAAIGEIWWLHEGQGHSTTLLDPASGRDLGSVSSAVGNGLLPRPGCPLTVKTLHTQGDLSLQVHPGAFGGALCKAETWIFLDVRGGSRVLAGLLEGTTLESLRESLSGGNPASSLRTWDVRPGSFMHLPPGTVHSLGGGLEVLEIQQSCDVTYRLSDWGRLGADGLPRRLDVDEGLKCVDVGGGRPLYSESGPPPGLESMSGYGIEKQEACNVDLPGGGLFFSAEGGVTVCGEFLESPCCLVASAEGGSLRAEGFGYAAASGGERWLARSGR
jgi:mannose-6-phosphate isomerase class I